MSLNPSPQAPGLDQEAPPAWPAFLAGALVLALLALVQADLWLLHPGLRSFDELGELSRIQYASLGQWPPFYFGGHALSAMAYAGLLETLGAWAVQTRLLSCAAVCVEAWLLFRLAKSLWGPLAGLGSVLVLCLNAYTLARTRTLFSFQMMPADFLILLSCLPHARRYAWAWGLGIGLLLMDYEGWVLALPALAVAWAALPQAARPPLKQVLGGFFIAVALVAWWTLPYLETYVGQRIQSLVHPWPSLLTHLRQIFFGGASEEALIGRLASWPPWTLPWLLLGLGPCWKSQRWVFASLLGAVLLLLVADGRTETNRVLAAWPALCLCSGAGAALSWAWLKRRSRLLAPLLWLGLALAGGAHQVGGYLAEMKRWDFDAYEYSRRLGLARDFLRERHAQHSLRLLSGLNYRDMGEVDFYFRGLGSAQGEETWAVLFDEQLPPGPRPPWGEWREFRVTEKGRALLLLKLRPGLEGRFENVQSRVAEVLGSYLRVDQRIDRAAAYLLSPQAKDPFEASIILDAYLRAQDLLGWRRPDWPALAPKLPLYTTRQRLWLSQAFETRDPAQALHWAETALRLDPGRESARTRIEELNYKYPSLKLEPHP